MERKMRPRLILCLLACSPVAHAELVFDISEEIVSPTQTNIVIHGYGSANIDGLSVETENNRGSYFSPNFPIFELGPEATATLYKLPNSLQFFGTVVSGLVYSNTTSQTFGYTGYFPALIVPQGYVSGEALENTMTIFNLNFSTSELSAGESYSVSWAVGTADEDSLTVNIVPESTNFTISPSVVNGQFVISHTSDSGFSYQLEQSGNLHSGSWTNHGSAVVGNDATNSFTINPADATLRYYRVQSHVQE
jgi:hypothetical protein